MEQPTDEQLAVLIDASYRVKLQKELSLLQRTKILFDRFPNSRHPVKVSKENLNNPKGVGSEPDEAFEAGLQADPDLMEFLRPFNGSTSFYLPARTKWVQERVEALTLSVGQASFDCALCKTGYLYIRHEQFD